MKKTLSILALLVICVLAFGLYAARALDTIPLPTDGSFYDGTVNSAARAALSNAIVNVIIPAQVDTALTNTVSTAYIPRRAGDILVGKVSTTNAVWVSVGTTTNDWVQIKP